MQGENPQNVVANYVTWPHKNVMDPQENSFVGT